MSTLEIEKVEKMDRSAAPPMIHLRWEGQVFALCGYRFPVKAVTHDYPPSANECVVCEELVRGLYW
jgi:hypothetical protein